MATVELLIPPLPVHVRTARLVGVAWYQSPWS